MNNETLADILREMRAQVVKSEEQWGMITPAFVQLMADRIEAAAERERERAEALSLNASIIARKEEAADWRKRTANVVAMREALMPYGAEGGAE